MTGTIPFTDLKTQYLEAKEDIDKAIKNVVETSSFITGPLVDNFEQALINYTGAEACASCGSGTTALQIALRACDIGPGDEVITTSHTFVSTVEAIVNVGATPVFADIDSHYHLDFDTVHKLVTPRTKGILFVDLYGQTPDINKIKDLKKQGIYIIQDSAQSFGSDYLGQKVGSIEHVDICCVSFNPVKNLGAMGDAGCVLGKKNLVDRARMFRDHGRQQKFLYEEVGYNCRIDNMQATIVQAKLPYLDNWIKGKDQICGRYNQELADVVTVPKITSWSTHGWYVYVIKCTDRDGLQQHLKNKGIGTNIHYPNPVHCNPAYKKFAKDPLPKTEHAAKNILSLPCYHNLSNKDQTYIIESIKQYYEY